MFGWAPAKLKASTGSRCGQASLYARVEQESTSEKGTSLYEPRSRRRVELKGGRLSTTYLTCVLLACLLARHLGPRANPCTLRTALCQARSRVWKCVSFLFFSFCRAYGSLSLLLSSGKAKKPSLISFQNELLALLSPGCHN